MKICINLNIFQTLHSIKKVILSLFLVYSINSIGQKVYTSEKDVFESKEIVFYGYDFSHFKLDDGKELANGNKIKKYIPAWIEFLNKYTDEEKLQRRFSKETVKFDFDYTNSLIKKVNVDELVVTTKDEISEDSIQGMINNYQLNDKEGIGFVVIVELFEKKEKRCTAYFVFFDIATKKILMSDYYGSNDADGYGLDTFWGKGLNETFAMYIQKVYKIKYKNFYK